MDATKLLGLAALFAFTVFVGHELYKWATGPANSSQAQKAKLALTADPRNLSGTHWRGQWDGPAPDDHTYGDSSVELVIKVGDPISGRLEADAIHPYIRFAATYSKYDANHLHMTPNSEDAVNFDAYLTNPEATEMQGTYNYPRGSARFTIRRVMKSR
jgi:hypothetical protein